MKYPNLPRNLLHLTVAVCLAASAVGCGARGKTAGPADLSTAKGQPSASSFWSSMSAKDRERLEAISAKRRAAGGDAGYLIGPDDLLDIRIPDLIDASSTRGPAPVGQTGPYVPVVAQAPLFQQGIRVDSDGKITLPFIGEVTAAGKTPADLEKEITDRLVEKQVLRSPQVSVQIVEYRNRTAAVVGSVERPGLYPLTRPGTTVADLLWTAGGPSKEAGRFVEFAPASADLQASEDAQPIRMDLDTLLRANGLHDHRIDVPARPGDVITVSPAGSVLVDGWVTKPGSYPVTRGLTVTGVVTAAGGELFPAARRKLTIARVDGSYQTPVSVDLDAIADGQAPDVPIADGDVVRVPARPLMVVPWGFWTIARDIVRLGASAPVY